MSEATIRELWRRHLDGPPLTRPERDELAAALAGDEALRAECLAEGALHERMRVHGRTPEEDEAFVETVARQCRYAGGSERFAKQVRSRLGRTRSRPRRRSRFAPSIWVPLLAAGLALAVLVPLLGRQAPATPTGWTVLDVSGTPRSEAGGILARGDTLAAGSRFTGGTGDRLRLDGAGLMTVELVAAQVVVPSISQPTWRLDRGILTAQVESRAGRGPFEVITPHATIQVVGTRFTVEVGERTHLAVEHGTVRFGADGDWQEVAAGGQASLPRGREDPPEVLAETGEARTGIPSLRAYYRFAADGGNRIADRSGHGLDLTIAAPQAVSWQSGALTLRSETHLIAVGDVGSLIDACIAAGGFSLEADLTLGGPLPFRTEQVGPGRIVTISQNSHLRNATLGWGEIGLTQPALVLRLRQGDAPLARGSAALNGSPTHWIPSPLPGTRIHLLVTYQEGVGARWFVDGKEVPGETWDYSSKQPLTANGSLGAWSHAAQLALGGELVPNENDGGLRPWLGTYHLVAVYGAALDPVTALQLTAP